jgi:hypothetical protein
MRSERPRFSLVGSLSKGNQVNIPERGKWMRNVATQGAFEDICRDPGKSSLFFLTPLQQGLESVWLAIGPACKQERVSL